jgi:hypothetical protein
MLLNDEEQALINKYRNAGGNRKRLAFNDFTANDIERRFISTYLQSSEALKDLIKATLVFGEKVEMTGRKTG